MNVVCHNHKSIYNHTLPFYTKVQIFHHYVTIGLSAENVSPVHNGCRDEMREVLVKDFISERHKYVVDNEIIKIIFFPEINNREYGDLEIAGEWGCNLEIVPSDIHQFAASAAPDLQIRAQPRADLQIGVHQLRLISRSERNPWQISRSTFISYA